MTRTLRCILPAAALCLLPICSRAQTDPAPNTPLPVRSVSLFTSGVSYIERAGTVDGNESVALSFPTEQINDLLKSLVLIDSGGQVQAVTYGARDPISHALQSFAIDVSQPLPRGELLQKLRGARVAVAMVTGPTLTGQIVSVETHPEHRADGTVLEDVSSLNLLTDAGLQSVDLKNTQAVQILDPRLSAEFKQALLVLASGTDTTHRPVTLHFAGTGRREVRVGYVTEAPLWKVSYRLLIGGTGMGKAPKEANYLQGWALVENTTDDDWNGIHLSLVSGRPVSFIEDLYQPLYLPRPVVPVDVVASPYPQTHGANLQEGSDHIRGNAYNQTGYQVDGIVVPDTLTKSASAAPAPVMQAPASPPRAFLDANGTAFGANSAFGAETMRSSVQAQASGASVGEQYAYNVSLPVTLPRQQAAMIPIVAQDIGGDKVLLYNADTDPQFPLDAVRLRNTTKLHLKGGPVTLFDGGAYAGDARMEDVAPGETRLISYAVDLSVHGDRKTNVNGAVQISLYAHRGVLTVTRRRRTETTYTFKSQAAGPRTLLIEQPYDEGDVLVQPAKSDERTPDVYRFALPILPAKTAALTVVTERPLSTDITLFDADLDVIGVYASDTSISASQRTALQSVIQQRREIDTLRGAAQSRLARVASFTADQQRIRDNMKALDKSSALYKRYAAELDTQETQIQSLRTEAAALSAKADTASDTLRSRLDTLTL